MLNLRSVARQSDTEPTGSRQASKPNPTADRQLPCRYLNPPQEGINLADGFAFRPNPEASRSLHRRQLLRVEWRVW
jgi:hypothetical protein